VRCTPRLPHASPCCCPGWHKRPLRALELAAEWSRLLDVVAWLQAHPRPGMYLRQVDLPGIHTKFIESQRGVLAELLDLALPAAAIDPSRTGAQQFAARYGFLDKPVLLRLRILDPALGLLPGAPCPDLALDADSFARLRLDVARVFITENETNFLAFPRVDKAIVIFGAGYGWEALARAEWLQRCPIHYWGDIDTNGFAILAQLRARFAHVESLLMDRVTLLAHEALWGREDSPRPADVSRLSAEERGLYEDLRNHHIRPSLRLEQEHIGFGWPTDSRIGAVAFIYPVLARCSIRRCISTASSSRASSRRMLQERRDHPRKPCARPEVARRSPRQGPPPSAAPADPTRCARAGGRQDDGKLGTRWRLLAQRQCAHRRH
jgi:hypothetical protein